MKTLEIQNMGVTELIPSNLHEINGGLFAIHVKWASFWRGVGWGVGAGAAGAAAYYAAEA